MKYDFDPELEQLLRSMKNDPAFGGSFDSKKSWEQVAKYCGFPKDISDITHTWRDYLEFYFWEFSHQMFKPLAAVSIFVMLFVSGWIGAANASLGSIPGNRLYPIKIGMEKVQLALATSGSQRAQLRTEFANRRLEEMVEIAASSKQSDSIKLADAVDRFKQDVSEMKNDLSNSQDTSPQTTELAKAVGRKADVYASTVKASSPTLSKDVQQKVKEVDEIISQTKEQAVEVMVTAHEQVQTEDNTHELEMTFEKAFAHAQTIAEPSEQVKLKQASDLQKQGVYRRAFQVLKEIELAHTK